MLFRGLDGVPGALIDRCPHRGAALSLGRVGDDGCIECPFHGWRFDISGKNCRVPLNPGARRDRLGATALPVRQFGDLIWIYTGADAEPSAPALPEGLVDDGLARVYVKGTWHCHWTRAMENMLDSPHLPFVHRSTIGRPMRRQMTRDSKMVVTWEDTPAGGRVHSSMDEQKSPAFLEFFRPNIMVLNIPIPGKHLRIHALVIPEAAGRTRLMVAASRDFARFGFLNPWFAWMNGRIADEDRAVVESTGSLEIPPAGQDLSVATDSATLQFRKYYYEVLRSSLA